jgi:hypothetical protein
MPKSVGCSRERGMKNRKMFARQAVPLLLGLLCRLKVSKGICLRNLGKELPLRARKLFRQRSWKRKYQDTHLRIGLKT